MPASLRAHVSRGTASSSRPYDRRSPTASPAQSVDPLVHSHLSRSLPPVSPIQDPNPETQQDPETPPDHPGLPTYADYKRIEAEYLQSLSPRKRDKALITQAMFDKIWDVLHQPEACTIETPQFRFWVRKMFSLSRPMCGGDGGWGVVRVGGMGMGMGMYPDMAPDSDAEEADLELERAMGIKADTSAELFSAVVLHENRPVAIMEQLYELFCYCHVRAGHGGRDKTCAVIRQHYSWVPKELTAQFVKACPTCALKRSGHGHGHGHGGMGVGVGVLMQRRAVGQRERRVRGTPLGAEEMPGSVVPSSLGSMGWPATGGPLDPVNPEPCSVREREWERERERERERAWVHAREDAGIIDRSSHPVSPGRASVDTSVSSSRTRSVPNQVSLEDCLPSGWSGDPRSLTADVSPFYLCDTTDRSVVGTTGFPGPFAVHENNRTRTRSDQEEKHSPTKTGLPPLASALSNESLDEQVNLTGLGPETAGECLPSVLRPLRLQGPIPSDTVTAESELPPPVPPSQSYLFQIDPVLLSFNYPGLSESGSAFSGAQISLALSSIASAGPALPSDVLATSQSHRLGAQGGMCHVTNVAGTGPCRLPRRWPSDCIDVESSNMPRTLDPSDECHDSPDSRLDHGAASMYYTALARDSFRTRRRGSRDRDGPLAMLYHCSADEVGQELDGTLSFSIMTDA